MLLWFWSKILIKSEHKLHVCINFLQVVNYSNVWKKVKQFDILRHCFMYPFVDCKLYHQQGATSNRCWHSSRQTHVPCDATASLWAIRENGITRTTHICVLTRYIGDFLNSLLFTFLNEMLFCNSIYQMHRYHYRRTTHTWSTLHI